MAPTLPSADTEGEEFEMVSEKPEEKPEEPKLRRKAVCEAEVRIFYVSVCLNLCLQYFLFVFCLSRPIFKIGWLGMFVCFGLADRFLKSVGWKFMSKLADRFLKIGKLVFRKLIVFALVLNMFSISRSTPCLTE